MNFNAIKTKCVVQLLVVVENGELVFRVAEKSVGSTRMVQIVDGSCYQRCDSVIVVEYFLLLFDGVLSNHSEERKEAFDSHSP